MRVFGTSSNNCQFKCVKRFCQGYLELLDEGIPDHAIVGDGGGEVVIRDFEQVGEEGQDQAPAASQSEGPLSHRSRVRGTAIVGHNRIYCWQGFSQDHFEVPALSDAQQ